MQDDDDDDNDDPMILNNRAKNHTSERTIVPWTVIFSEDVPKRSAIFHILSLDDKQMDLASWQNWGGHDFYKLIL